MKPRTKLIVTAAVSSVLTFTVLSPMISFPGAKPERSAVCNMGQVTELERFGSVEILYKKSIWDSQQEKGPWVVDFYSSFLSSDVYLSFGARSESMCAAIDEVYFKVMEHPMKPKD